MLGLAEKPKTLKQQYDELDAQSNGLERQKAAVEQQLREKLDAKDVFINERRRAVRAGDHNKIDQAEEKLRRVGREIESLELAALDLDEQVAQARSELHTVGVQLGQQQRAQQIEKLSAELNEKLTVAIRHHMQTSAALADVAATAHELYQLDHTAVTIGLKRINVLRTLTVNGGWRIRQIETLSPGWSLPVQPIIPPPGFDFDKFAEEMLRKGVL